MRAVAAEGYPALPAVGVASRRGARPTGLSRATQALRTKAIAVQPVPRSRSAPVNELTDAERVSALLRIGIAKPHLMLGSGSLHSWTGVR